MFKGKIEKAIFDLDNTLFDTELVKNYFREVVKDYGFSPEEIFKEVKRNDGQVTYRGFVDVMDRKLFSRKICSLNSYNLWIKEIEEKVKPTQGATEVLQILTKYQIENYLLTLGVKDWQIKKIEWINLSNYFKFENIFFTEDSACGKIEEIKKIIGESEGEKVVFFNDKPDETENILEVFPKMRAFLRREEKDERYTEQDFINLKQRFNERVIWSNNLKNIIPDLFKIL